MFQSMMNKLVGSKSHVPMQHSSPAVAKDAKVYDVLKLNMEQKGIVHVGHNVLGHHVAVFEGQKV
jgi:hypothetical protein